MFLAKIAFNYIFISNVINKIYYFTFNLPVFFYFLEHWLTQDPHPDGNPLHLVGKGGRKQDPSVPLPSLTVHELFLQSTWQFPPLFPPFLFPPLFWFPPKFPPLFRLPPPLEPPDPVQKNALIIVLQFHNLQMKSVYLYIWIISFTRLFNILFYDFPI